MGNLVLSENDLDSIRRSFLNITALFLSKGTVDSKYVGCLMKWAVQLQFKGNDLRYIEDNFHKLGFEMPETTNEKIDAIFDLVYMIYLDDIIEDIELEVTSIYAEHLGLNGYIVSEILQFITTAQYEGKTIKMIKGDIHNILKNR